MERPAALENAPEKPIDSPAPLPLLFRVAPFLLVFILYGYGLATGLSAASLAWLDEARTGGASALSPLKTVDALEVSDYWNQRKEARELLARAGGTLRLYRPPAAQLLAWMEATVFGGWSPGYHLVGLLLFAGLAAAIGLAARRFGAEPLTALAASLVFAAHPALLGQAIPVTGQPALLATLLAFVAADRLDWGRSDRPRRERILAGTFFAFALFADAAALALPAALAAGIWRDGLVSDEASAAASDPGLKNREKRNLLPHRLGFLIAPAAAFLFFRAFFPTGPSVGSAAAWYLDHFSAMWAAFFLRFLPETTCWAALMPPMSLPATPLTLYAFPLLTLLFPLFSLYRVFRDRSALAAVGLAGLAAAMLLRATGGVRPETLLPAGAFLGLMTADVFVWISRMRFSVRWKAVFAAALALAFVPSVLFQITGYLSLQVYANKTADRLAENLSNALDGRASETGEGRTVWVLNAWPGATDLERRMRWAKGREVARVEILAASPLATPKGLPVPEDAIARAFTRHLHFYGGDPPELSLCEGRVLHATLRKGAWLTGLADWSPMGGIARMPVGRDVRERDFRVRLEANAPGTGSRLRIRFDRPLRKGKDLVAVLQGGTYRLYDPDELACEAEAGNDPPAPEQAPLGPDPKK